MLELNFVSQNLGLGSLLCWEVGRGELCLGAWEGLGVSSSFGFKTIARGEYPQPNPTVDTTTAKIWIVRTPKSTSLKPN